MITVFYSTGCYYLAVNELCILFLFWLAMTHSIVRMAATITTDADVWPKHKPGIYCRIVPSRIFQHGGRRVTRVGSSAGTPPGT